MKTANYFLIAMAIALPASGAFAAGQSSANYSIRADSVNAGVANTSSANFSVGSTVGEAGFSQQTNSFNARIDGGFRAQVINVNTPVMTVLPTTLNLGNSPVGVAAAALNVTISNQGGAALNLSAITITGTNAADFTRSGICTPTATIAAAASCTATITFTPGGLGSRAATLTVTGNDPVNPVQSVSLSGAGGAGSPAITVSVTGAGAVSSNPAGISCPGTCAATFTIGSSVVFTASATVVSVLQAFTGCDTTTGLTCTISPFNASRNLSAAFIPTGAATPPGAPTIGSAIAGNGQATINFTPPASNGGSVILGYTAACAAGTVTANGNASPITVTGLANGVATSCNVVAINGAGTSAPSANVNVTPAASALTLQQVVSRKLHSGTPYDIDIDRVVMIGGNVSVEPRTIGAGHSVVFVFDALITDAGGVSVIDVNSNSVGTATTVASGNSVVVTITGVPDNKRVTINVFGVNTDANGSVAIGFLVGDVNGTRSVNSSDISSVKARSGQSTSALNFKFDVNASGAVNSSDISAVKARSGLTLPP